MKKIILYFCFTIFLTMVCTPNIYAESGQMGFFGGINEGKRLPKTTERLLQETSTGRTKKNTNETSVYKEMIFLSGKPVEFEGLLTVKTNGGVVDTSQSGLYKVTYDIKGDNKSSSNIRRTIVFNVRWRREGKQIIKDYEVNSWRETVTTDTDTFTLDPKQSHFDISILEDVTPGVTYYKGDVSARAVYGEGDDKIILESSGSLYGYDCAWSSTETHRIDSQLFNGDWQMQYQVRPSVSVGKTLQYSKNEPSVMSFNGNYIEVMSNDSGLTYSIFNAPNVFYDVPKQGGASISSYNTFEQLIAPDVSFLKGSPADSDVKKLFAMGILDDNPKFYQPYQAITRGQLITMLVKAVKIPVEMPETVSKVRSKKKVATNVIFPDVPSDRPDYPYIMAAYKTGLAVGRGGGHFSVDYPIEREEALVIMLRTLGLGNLGLDPTPVTPFSDDEEVSDWARKDLYAAYKLGLIKPNSDGNINPKANISKAEAAAITNMLIDYMRTGIRGDYTEHIVNYAD